MHRDIKPSNLLRAIDGTVKLADLGLARIDPTVSDVARVAELTESGSAAGTVDYMAPEQAIDATKSDHRADIYSLGCTLYFLLAGGPIFEKPMLVSRILAHREEEAPSLNQLKIDVPNELNDIYLKMVAKSPDDRFQSMEEVTQALKALTDRSASQQISTRSWTPEKSTIAVVESSNLQIGMIRHLFEQIGADDLHSYSSGDEVLESLAIMPPDVVLASMELPDITGIELAQRIREDIRWSRMAIVLMSSSELPDDVVSFIERTPGMQALRKPFDSAKLKAAIEMAFKDERRDESSLSSLSAKQVLVIDDSRVARRHMQSVLTRLGFVHFTTASNGAEAVELMKYSTYDLVVTDYNMPEMNGRDLIIHIREQGQQRDVPIIMCTTEFDPAKLGEIYQLGVSAICNKSFEIELVRNVVIRLFH